MFLALRDLRFAKGRFALTGSVVALLALLIVVLTGLAVGLMNDNIGGIRALPADHISFNAEAGVKWNRSVVDQRQWEALARTPGVTAAVPLGNSLANGQAYHDAAEADRARSEILTGTKSETKGIAVDLALFGMEPGTFVVPAPATGEPLGTTPDGVLVSDALVQKGVRVGDTIVLDRAGTRLRVIGTTPKANYGHVAIVYTPLRLWQEYTFGPPGGPGDGTELPEVVYRRATVIASQVQSGTDLSGADAELGLKTVGTSASFAGSPGYSEESGSLVMIMAFLYAIAALVVGAFFTVWTIQRRHEIGLVKAIGGSTGYLVRDALGQAAVILVLATAVGLVLGTGLGALIPGGAPFALEPAFVLPAALAVVLAGLAGATLAIVRIAKVDPLIALGGAR